jgi:hypothetical protein
MASQRHARLCLFYDAAAPAQRRAWNLPFCVMRRHPSPTSHIASVPVLTPPSIFAVIVIIPEASGNRTHID